MTWTPDWEAEPAPCEEPTVCSPEHPICEACLGAKQIFLRESTGTVLSWPELHEWQREAWRREYADQ